MKTLDAITVLENFLNHANGDIEVARTALKCLKGMVLLNTMPLSPAAQRIVNVVQSYDSLGHCVLPVGAPTVQRLLHNMVAAAFQVQMLTHYDDLYDALRPMGNLVMDEPDGGAPTLQQMVERTVAMALEGKRFREGVMTIIGEPQ